MEHNYHLPATQEEKQEASVELLLKVEDRPAISTDPPLESEDGAAISQDSLPEPQDQPVTLADPLPQPQDQSPLPEDMAPEAEDQIGIPAALPLTGEATQQVSTAQPLPQPQQLKSRPKRARKWFFLLLCIILLLGMGASILAVFGYRSYKNYNAEYHRYMSLAQSGITHLRTAAALLSGLPHDPLNTHRLQQAQQEFSGALTDFVSLDTGLRSLPAIVMSIPTYAAKLHAARDLLPIAIETAHAGQMSCAALNVLLSKLRNPLITRGQGLSTADMSSVSADLTQLKQTFSLITDQINHLTPADQQLDPRIGKLIAAFHQDLPMIQAGFNDADKLLSVLPALIGIASPSYYLIEVLDSTELRPGGGFIGNYGFLTLSGGQVKAVHITDVDLLDRPFEAAGNSIAYPPAYSWFDIAPGSWSLRDSNLDADFPTAARYAEQNYKLEGGKVPLQGVIAITPALIQEALTITGPISVPEYHEVVTAQNLIDRIHYHQLGAATQGSDTTPSPDGQSSVRKRFTALLGEHFLTRIHQLGSAVLPRFLPLLIKSLSTKDIQIYFNSSIAESYLHRYHFDAAIQAPPNDSLFVVDANIGSDKANSFIANTMNDQVTIDTQGNAVHRTTLSYAWTTPGPIYGLPLYRDYVRIYAPPGSILQRQDGWDPRGTSTAFGRTVWAGFFTLEFGQTNTITLQWTVPHAAIKGLHGWHYQYLLQRQVGTSWSLRLRISLPPCAVIAHLQGALVKNGKLAVTLIHPLNTDMNEGIDYAC